MVIKFYLPEFKADAVALFHSDPDLTIAQTARDLGINGGRPCGTGSAPTASTAA